MIGHCLRKQKIMADFDVILVTFLALACVDKELQHDSSGKVTPLVQTKEMLHHLYEFSNVSTQTAEFVWT